MGDNNQSLTIPTKVGSRKQLDREKKELLDMIREAEGVPDDYHPLVEMARLANSSRIPANLKMRAHAEVAQYTTPKLRTVDPTGGKHAQPPVLELVQISRTAEEQALLEAAEAYEIEHDTLAVTATV